MFPSTKRSLSILRSTWKRSKREEEYTTLNKRIIQLVGKHLGVQFMKHYSHNSIAGFPGLLCVNHDIDFMQIITFCWMLGCRGWGRKGGQLRKNQKGWRKKSLLLFQPLLQRTSSWTPRTLLRKRGKPLPPAFLSQGGLQTYTCQTEPFIFLVWLGLNYWKGEEWKIVDVPWG